jgi:hypothetical protein
VLNPTHHIALRQHIIKVLLYYDIFHYPLKSNEIFRFLGTYSVSEKDVVHSLHNLMEDGVLFRYKDFYSVQSGAANFERRVKGNKEASRCLEIAKRKANFIATFPFVRGVFASGSLAKEYMDEKSDLDFFVITAPKRLWIARTLLVMYKRVFLFNSHKYFCLNYFVDEDHLEIEEKNLFTATELATVIPLYGATQYASLMNANPWLKSFFPNYVPRSTEGVPAGSGKGLKGIIERTLNLFFPGKIENYFKNITVKRWKKLYEKEYSKADFEIAFKSKEYASKNHPQHFQRKVIELHEEKLRLFNFSILKKEKAGINIQS